MRVEQVLRLRIDHVILYKLMHNTGNYTYPILISTLSVAMHVHNSVVISTLSVAMHGHNNITIALGEPSYIEAELS